MNLVEFQSKCFTCLSIRVLMCKKHQPHYCPDYEKKLVTLFNRCIGTL